MTGDQGKRDAAAQPAAPGTVRGTGRMEAFTDGVFAIAITLLVLDIKLPAPRGDEPVNLLGALIGLWPSYLAYLISFVMIGIYWVNHHFTGKLYKEVDHVFLLLNLLFLLAISFLPFPTRVLAEHWTEEGSRATAATFYTAGLLLPAATWFLKWLYAGHGRRFVDERLDPRFVRHLTLLYGASFALYLAAVLLTLASPLLGLALATGLTLLYLLPPPPPRYLDDDGT